VTAGALFVFEPFEVDPLRRRLTSGGEPVAISDRHLDVLLMLVGRAGQIVSKDDLLEAGWKDVAVGDNSLEQAISSLRRLLGARCIETVPRRGYRFGAAVTRRAQRETDAGLDALLAPHRAFIEGRAALESLEAEQIARARTVFERAVVTAPESASAHIGLASACVLQFETTRTDSEPDAAALAKAVHHAREACRLDAQSGEAWATLGFVLDRARDHVNARAASRRAVALEPDNWRHHFRLAFVSWGEERLRAAGRTLALLPDFPLAHWLAATVYVARQVLTEAERELKAGLAVHVDTANGHSRFSSVALHWLLGLIYLAYGDETRALGEFELELSLENAGHLYARECCANSWYAIGALRLRQGRKADACAAFQQAVTRVSHHPMPHVGLIASGRRAQTGEMEAVLAAGQRTAVDIAFPRAAQLVHAGAHSEAARLVDEGLAAAADGRAGWLLPVEPLLHVNRHPEIWADVLTRLRNRAA
jgi:DNA-binding winged helix-turn-helix (wHTH) protein